MTNKNAQQRPRPKSRRHHIDKSGSGAGISRSTKAETEVSATLAIVDRVASRIDRSTKAETEVSATHLQAVARRDISSALNKGRDRSLGDTPQFAIQLPGAPGRSTKAETEVSATRLVLSNIWASDQRSTKAETEVSATPSSFRLHRQARHPLNKGRDRSLGDTAQIASAPSPIPASAQQRPRPKSRRHP